MMNKRAHFIYGLRRGFLKGLTDETIFHKKRVNSTFLLMVVSMLFYGVITVATNVYSSNTSSIPPTFRSQAQNASDKAGYDPSLFSALRWRSIGPNRGGRSIACAGSLSRTMEYYFGATGGGLWKTTDGGTTWRSVTDGQIKSSSVGAVAVSESNPDVVYIGMGEVQLRNDILQGDGVYKSSDGGKTWTHMGLEETQVISRVRVHPQNPDIVYAAAFGHPYGPNEERGVYRSKDGGKSWQKILFRDNCSGAADLVMDRQNPNILFASIWEARISPGGAVLGLAVSSGGPGSGFFKSTNGGDTWSEITRNPGLPKGIIGKVGISISSGDPNRVYALIEAEDGGVFRSDDGGATWTKVNEEGGLRQRPSYFNRICADPEDKDTVYVLNLRFYKSTDGGKTFTTIRVPHADNHDLWIAPNDSRRMIESNDGGANVSFNGGESWSGQEFPTAQFYHVATTKDIPYHVCGAQQDANTICVPSNPPLRSINPIVGGSLSGPVYAVGGGESGTIAPHPRDPDLFFATGPQGVITRFDRHTGLTQARDIQVSPRWEIGEDRERFEWTIPLIFSHHDPNVLYVASQHLWRTANGGMKWERISPDLSRAETKDQDFPKVGSIFAIAPSYHDPNTIWAGTNDGLIHITRDEGKNWQEVTPPDLPEFSRISLIEASPHKPGTAYVAAKRYELDDRAPYIFKSDDYGKSWKKIVSGIPSNDFVHAVREDPKRAGLLYAGTEHGVYVSFDDGNIWQSLSLNLPDTQVPDLVVEQNDLVIATHGRSFYILDDIGPLRQITPQIATAAFYLFRPRDTIRRLNQAVIDYVLKAPAQRVVIEILDSSGKIIRTFASAVEENIRGENRQQGREGMGRLRAPRPSCNVWLNRFTWDLRYEGATVFPGMVMWVGSPIGPIAAPGNYLVRVTADGMTQTQALKVLRDPRPTDLTDADIQEQFSLAIKVRDKISEANEAVILIRDVKRQIRDRIEKAKDNQIASVGESLNKKLSEVEGEIYQVRLRSQLDALNYPIKLNNRLANLQLSIETGDGRPTEQAYKAFQKLSSELDMHIGKMNDALKTEAIRFNRLLADRKLEPIKMSR
jgi:photosystem II stability/assembly factor-like uncharacterized protein